MMEMKEEDFFEKDRRPGETDAGKSIEVFVNHNVMRPATLRLDHGDSRRGYGARWSAVDDEGWSIPLERCHWRYAKRGV